MTTMNTTGLLLAAGAGRRMGSPKALVHDPDGTSWLRRSVRALTDGGCTRVVVVLGAGSAEARVLLDGLPVEIVVADGWADGMGASLRAGLAAVGHGDGALVSLVDLPDVGPAVVARVLAGLAHDVGLAGDAGMASAAKLARAAYGGQPGHPVWIGASHVEPLMMTLHGDEGARAYLQAHDVTLIECGDLATGADVDQR